MSRNASGTYTLIAGNPVVTGTVISSTWANNTLNDIATALTDSLDRTGKGAMSAPLKLVSGTAALPGLTFDAANNAGLSLLAAAGDVPAGFGMSYAGAEVARIATGQLYVSAGKIRGVAPSTATTTSLALQTSVTNDPTYVNILPNGTSVVAALRLHPNSDIASTDTGVAMMSNGAGDFSFKPSRADGGAVGTLAFSFFHNASRANLWGTAGGDVFCGPITILPNSTSGFVYMQTVSSDPKAGGATPFASTTHGALLFETGATPKLWLYANGTWYIVALSAAP